MFFDCGIRTCGSVRRWSPCGLQQLGDPGSLTGLVKTYVEPRNPVKSRNSFEESANLMTEWALEGLNKPQSGQLGSI